MFVTVIFIGELSGGIVAAVYKDKVSKLYILLLLRLKIYLYRDQDYLRTRNQVAL